MTKTRASAAAKGKARAVSPRAHAERAAAARTSAERAAAFERVAAFEHAVAVRAPADHTPTPYQDRAAAMSASTDIPNGTQQDIIVLAAHSVEGELPVVTRRRTRVTDEVLHGAEAAAALAVISAASAAGMDDPDAMVISRPSSPLPPARLTDAREVARFSRRETIGQLIDATRDAIAKKVELESADAELAAELQAEEVVAMWNMNDPNRASTSQAACAATPAPCSPMDIVAPSPYPIPRRATPETPSPASRLGSASARGQGQQYLTVGEDGMIMLGPYNAQGCLPPSYIPEEQVVEPSSALLGNAATAGASSSTQRSGTLRRNAVAGSSNLQRTEHRNAVVGPPQPPAYALNEPGTSFFTMPVRPSPQNGFSEHEVIQTLTEIIDGTPYITIFDTDAATEAASDDEYLDN